MVSQSWRAVICLSCSLTAIMGGLSFFISPVQAFQIKINPTDRAEEDVPGLCNVNNTNFNLPNISSKPNSTSIDGIDNIFPLTHLLPSQALGSTTSSLSDVPTWINIALSSSTNCALSTNSGLLSVGEVIPNPQPNLFIFTDSSEVFAKTQQELEPQPVTDYLILVGTILILIGARIIFAWKKISLVSTPKNTEDLMGNLYGENLSTGQKMKR